MKRQVRLARLILLACLLHQVSLAQQIEHNSQDNTISSILFNQATRPDMVDVEQTLRAQLQLPAEYSFRQKFDHKRGNEQQTIRYNLYYQNIKVEHAFAAVMSVNGQPSFISANIFKQNSIPAAAPALTEQQALQSALNNISAKDYMWEIDKNYTLPQGELVYVQDFTQETLTRQQHLAYKFDIYAQNPLSRNLVYVDALTGEVLLKDALLKHISGSGTSVYSGNVTFEVDNTGPIYYLYDVGKDIVTYDAGGNFNIGGAPIVSHTTTLFPKDVSVDAHWGATKVYDYWDKEHNWQSFDGQGTVLKSYVNFGNGYDNAFWSGTEMVYGNGTGMFFGGFDKLVSLDVCAHEIGHGICQATSGLVYAKESGAMNEAFSDIWAAVVEFYAAPDKQKWSIGEEIGKNPLRSMSNPNHFKDPDTHGGTHWKTVIGCTPDNSNDQCGVHSNSGVLNHWFYLLVEGGKGINDKSNAYEVAGIGMEKAAKIAFETEKVLSPNADYAECRTKSLGVVVTLYGNCSRELEALTKAWYAVGVGNDFVPCAPQIGFAMADTVVSKVATGTNCPAVKTISIPMRVVGNAPTGGNATVTVSTISTSTKGIDYDLPGAPLTFNAGSTAGQNVQVQIFDNGNVNGEQEVKLYFTITQNGSNATTSYTYDTCTITITAGEQMPDTGGVKISQVNMPDIRSRAVTPFFSRNDMGRMVFIVTAEELHAAGVKPNEVIDSMQFNITEKNSTQAFTNFTVKISPVSISDLTGGIPNVTTQYYSGNFTTHAGWNTIPFSTPLTWNGTDNLAIETCFTNTTNSSNSDFIAATGGDKQVSAIAYSDIASNGCSMSFTATYNYFSSYNKPVIRLVQPKLPAQAEQNMVSSRQWDVHPGQEVYFKNDTTRKLITGLNNIPIDIGCTNASVSAQGKGWSNIPGVFYAGVKRSVKEFSVLAQNNTDGSHTYDITIYFDTSELSGADLSDVRMVSTDVHLDSAMHNANTEVEVPQVTKVAGYMAFTATFNGIGTFKGVNGRYFLTEKNFSLKPSESVAGLSKNTGNITVVNNPFTDKIYLNYNLTQQSEAQIRLFDIRGINIISETVHFNSGQHQYKIDLSGKLLTPGNYVLQVVTANEVMTQKMLKQ